MGLHQGDPLSHYMFITCVEGLTFLINHAETSGDIHGVKVCINALIILHMLFAYYCFLLYRANSNKAQKMKNILSTYGTTSMNANNLQKSEIFCSRNISHTDHNDIANILVIQVVLGPGKYLEFHSMIGRSKNFSYSKDRSCKIINSWSSKCLSNTRHEVQIKSMLKSFPPYFTSLFKLLSSLLYEIEKMMISFWSGRSGSRNKGMLIFSWNKLSMHKQDRGISFKIVSNFNLAMLRKYD